MRLLLNRFHCETQVGADKHYVYVYQDPRNKEDFYVGKGKDKRSLHHLKERSSTTKNHLKHNRIKDIRAAGYEPTIYKLADGVPERLAYSIERFVIKSRGTFLKRTGPLTNIVVDGWQRKYESKTVFQKISEGQKRSWKNPLSGHNTPARRQQIRDQMAGKSNPRFNDHRTYVDLHGEEKAKELRGLQSKARTGASNSRAKEWVFVSPSGDRFEVKGTTKQFCEKHELCWLSLWRVKNKQYVAKISNKTDRWGMYERDFLLGQI